MTEQEMVTAKVKAGWGWQAIGQMMGVSADRAKSKWEIVYQPEVCLPNLILERSALQNAIAEHRQNIVDALDRIAEIDRQITAVDE
jgi:predicted nucleotide-binding protein (sugar kinase/HSP70/actin superfamily)